MDDEKLELPKGTLELLILKGLARGSAHGYGLARWIESRSEGVLLVEEGSLYPAVHRLERNGLVEAEWGKTDTGRRAKFYSLTEVGEGELKARSARWNRLTQGVGLVLRTRGAGGAA